MNARFGNIRECGLESIDRNLRNLEAAVRALKERREEYEAGDDMEKSRVLYSVCETLGELHGAINITEPAGLSAMLSAEVFG